MKRFICTFADGKQKIVTVNDDPDFLVEEETSTRARWVAENRFGGTVVETKEYIK